MESPLRRTAPDDLVLIETLGWFPGTGYRWLPRHLDRLARGAAALGIVWDEARLRAALAAVSAEAPRRVRLTLALDGTLAVTPAPLPPAAGRWTVGIAPDRLDSADPWLRLKTSRRALYDAARAALPAGVDELLFLNERGEVCEGTITNLFVDPGGGLLTPPLGCGLLPGVLRAELLERGACREAILRPADLASGALFVGNALRGLIPARLAEA